MVKLGSKRDIAIRKAMLHLIEVKAAVTKAKRSAALKKARRMKLAGTKAVLIAAYLDQVVSAARKSKSKFASSRRPVSAETRAKLRAAHLGMRMSADTKAKLRKAHLGRQLSAETRAKIRAAHLGKLKPRKRAIKARQIFHFSPAALNTRSAISKVARYAAI